MADVVLKDCIESLSRSRDDQTRVVKDYNSFTVEPSKIAESTTNKENTSTSTTFIGKEQLISVVDDAVSLIGRTPIVRLRKLESAHGLSNCELYAKLEFMSVGGSVKDRIGRRMIHDASDRLKSGDYIIEATSGNTGIALAMMCAIKGYQMVCLMPQRMSKEKENCLVALGAVVIRTRNSARWDDNDSHIALAEKLAKALNERADNNDGRKAYFLDQYSSPSNLSAHYHETAEEILQQMGPDLDYFVAGTGTGGTFSGVSLRLKKEMPGIKCIAVDPLGSILHVKQGEYGLCKHVKPFEVEGVGYDFHPSTWHHEVADDFEVVDDYETFSTAREIIRTEGILCGGSSGLALAGAIKYAKKLQLTQDKNLKILVLFPDSIRNYLSKFVSDDWMVAHNLFKTPAQHRAYSGEIFKGHSGPTEALDTITLDKHHGDSKLIDVWRDVVAKSKSHVAVLDPKTMALVAILSKEVIEDQILKGYDSMAVGELCNKNSIYFIDERAPDVLDDLKIVLQSQFGEGKLIYPAVIVLPDSMRIIGKSDSPVATRNVYMDQDWSKEEVKVITPQQYISQWMDRKNV